MMRNMRRRLSLFNSIQCNCCLRCNVGGMKHLKRMGFGREGTVTMEVKLMK